MRASEPTVFPPEVVEELPKMLAALGVLWDPVERCLVLPLESEALRTVVHQRYVAPGAERVRISLLKEREAFERERNSLWGQADQSHQSTNYDGGGNARRRLVARARRGVFRREAT